MSREWVLDTPLAHALAVIARRIATGIARLPPEALPVRMVIAGGIALHLYTGARVTRDIDASFSRRLLLPDGLEEPYLDADGKPRTLYLDRQYNDSFSLLHEDANADALAVSLPGINERVLDVRVLTPLDLAVSKLARLSSQDESDIRLLLARRLVTPAALRKRATQALAGFVGNLDGVRSQLEYVLTPGSRRR